MSRKIIATLSLLFFASAASSQSTIWKKYRHEASIGYGFNNFMAGVGDNDKIGVVYLLQRSAFNSSYRYFITKKVVVRGSLSQGFAFKNDKNLDTSRLSLPVDYQASIWELAALCEYHFFDETQRGRSGRSRSARGGMARASKMGLSVFTGVALDHKRISAEYQGQAVELRPYNPKAGYDPPGKYKRNHLHIPVGAQMRFVLSEHMRAGIEIGYRFGLKDYMDNVSSIYYTEENPWGYATDGTDYPDKLYVGENVTFAKEYAPISSLSSNKGKRNYGFVMFTVAYRFKN